MKLIDGRAIAQQIREELKTSLASSNVKPHLAVLLVGEDHASQIYVKLKEKHANEIGISTDVQRLPATATDQELIRLIRQWNEDPNVDAILVQVPLPDGHNTDLIIQAMDPKKDVDGFHPENSKQLLEGSATLFPPVHESILRLIGATDTDLRGANAVIIANSAIFADPLSHLLTRAGCFVTVTSTELFDASATRNADIIVIAVGRANFLTRDLIKSGACIIDVGTNRLPDGRVVGDVDIASIADLPGWLSPVPGGVGPMTIAMLLKNTVELAGRRGDVSSAEPRST